MVPKITGSIQQAAQKKKKKEQKGKRKTATNEKS